MRDKKKDNLILFTGISLGMATGLLFYILGFKDVKTYTLISFMASVYWVEKLVSIFSK